MRMIVLQDSKTNLPDFFCSGCQNHKKGPLLSHKRANRSYCTACSLPLEERVQLGIPNPYENTAKQKTSIKHAAKSYGKPLSDLNIQAITGEQNGPTKAS